MKILKNKTKISAITFVLILTISAILVAFPNVVAHDPPWTIPTDCGIAVTNNPIGVNQQVVLFFWLNINPPTAEGAYGDRYELTVEVTKPDGSKVTLGPITSDSVGAGYTYYIPDRVGTYTLVAKFPGKVLTGLPLPPDTTIDEIRGAATVNDILEASTSKPISLTVQEEPIDAWSETPLPEEYWTRPINSANRKWYVLAANWLAGAAQNVGPTKLFNYGTGPKSAHIMWSTPMWAGGIMDARFGNTGYQTSHYEGLSFTPPIILNGKIYYNVESLPREGWRCLDLYTGEELYFRNTTGPVTGIGGGFDASGRISGGLLSFGQIYDYSSPNQHGGLPYLWSTNHPTEPNTWMMYDSYTGSYICSIANVSTRGTQVYGKDGSILYYNLDTRNNRLTCWNNTYAIWYEDTWSSNEYWMWRPTLNKTFDGNNGFSLNVSIPDVSGSILAVREGEFIIGGTSGKHNATYVEDGELWALSLEKGQEGTLLWDITYTPPETILIDGFSYSSRQPMRGPFVDPEDGVFYFREGARHQWWVYSLETGEQLWTATDPAMAMYGGSWNVYQGKLLSGGYSGVLIAYNITTSEVLWTFTAEQEGYESPYGNYPTVITCIADGKIYLVSGEHSNTQPLWRGSYLRCIDANTGTELWKVLHWGGAQVAGWDIGADGMVVIADGYLVGENAYDNKLYCYGKGPSSTTVTTSPKTIAKGNSVMIEGTVIDVSAGTKQLEQASRFPNGVPTVADEYMSEWMEFVYMQQSCPESYSGVPVKLEVFSEDGSYSELGMVKSNAYGDFVYAWTPPDEGVYTIMATFEGSDSYLSSYDATYISVGPASAPTTPIEPEEPTAEAPLIATEIAILVAAVIVAVAVIVGFWILRKRK